MGKTGGARTEMPQVQEKEKEHTTSVADAGRQRFKQRPIGGLPLCGKLLLSKGYDKETTKLIMDAWRPSNKKTVLYVFEQVVNVLYHKGHRQVRTNTATGM